jgi:hypothetical protein
VQTVAAFASLTGDEFVRDVTHLRAGQVWSEELARLIDEAQIFQLFWSSNSMVSPYVRDEWTYALPLNRPHFIRPLYWEVPLPERPEDDLPPQALRRIDFDLFSLSPDTVERVVALMAPRGVVCPTDGHLNDLDARYCVACGTPLASSGEAIRPPSGGRAPSQLPDAPTPTVSAPRPSAPSAPGPPAGGYEPEPHWRTPSPTTGSPGPTVGGRSRSRQRSWVLVAVLVLLLLLVALLSL